MTRRFTLLSALAAAMLLGGCRYTDETDRGADADAAAQPQSPAAAQPSQPSPSPGGGLRLEVDIAARQLRVFRGDSVLATHPVAVGSPEWPTPTGEWTIKQVIFNPRWVPPKEAWAKDEEEKEPGDPDNPLGMAQLVYEAPNSIHGTNEPESLGKAVSHGSIRAANDVVLQLARLVMDAGGAPRDESWYRRVQANRKERQEVPLPNPVPIRVVPGDSSSTAHDGSSNSARGGSSTAGRTPA